VLGVVLAREDHTVVATFGVDEGFHAPPLREPVWNRTSLALTVSSELPPVEGPHSGEMHGGPWQSTPATDTLSSGSYAITLVLDAAPVYSQVLRERVRFGVALAVASCAIAFAAGLFLVHARRLTLESDLARTRELAAENERLAQLGAGLAHETKNPLSVVRGLAQSIAETGEVPDAAHADAARIVDEVDRTVGHINAFLALSRPKEARLAATRLDAFLGEVVSLVRREAGEKGVTLEVSCGTESITADVELLRRALLNLLINALRACRSGCRIGVTARVEGRTVEICVTDDGCGIAADDLPHVKEPYFSRFEGGTGLGLAIVEQIVRAHGASLAILPQSGGGTCVLMSGFQLAE
jgi:signal transduction histidine kinase